MCFCKKIFVFGKHYSWRKYLKMHIFEVLLSLKCFEHKIWYQHTGSLLSPLNPLPERMLPRTMGRINAKISWYAFYETIEQRDEKSLASLDHWKILEWICRKQSM